MHESKSLSSSISYAPRITTNCFVEKFIFKLFAWYHFNCLKKKIRSFVFKIDSLTWLQSAATQWYRLWSYGAAKIWLSFSSCIDDRNDCNKLRQHCFTSQKCNHTLTPQSFIKHILFSLGMVWSLQYSSSSTSSESNFLQTYFFLSTPSPHVTEHWW